MLLDARRQVDALAGQLRSTVELASHATSAGGAAFDRREARQPWTLRITGALAALHSNLRLQSAAFRHALRLAGCLAVGQIASRFLGWQRAYWLPMTIAIVLKPDFAATFSRGLLRLAGTMISLALATGILHLLAAPRSVEIVFIAISTFVLRCFGPANYGILVAGITGYIVFAFAIAGVPPGPVIAARGLNTLAGGLIAMLAYWLWPTWERTQVSVTLAGMLDAYRAYFRAVTECYGNPDTRSPVQLDRTRLDARLARSNLEASVARLTAEPGTPSPGLMVMSAILANSHRLIQP